MILCARDLRWTGVPVPRVRMVAVEARGPGEVQLRARFRLITIGSGTYPAPAYEVQALRDRATKAVIRSPRDPLAGRCAADGSWHLFLAGAGPAASQRGQRHQAACLAVGCRVLLQRGP